MAPEEIKKLSIAYAEDMCPIGDYCGGVYDDQRNTYLPIYNDNAKSVLQWLSKDCIIIPKSNVLEWKCIVEEALKADRVITAPAFRFMWEGLFGKDTFEEEGK